MKYSPIYHKPKGDTTMGSAKKMTEKSFLSQMEKIYSEQYQIITGVPKTMARKFIKTLLIQIVKESKEVGTFTLPADYGQQMLNAATTDKKIAAEIAKLKKEGVNDDDIRNWWGLHDVERRLLLKLDEANRTALYLKLTTMDKISPSEANLTVQKYHPIFGSPDDTSLYKGDDRPLPPEIRQRVLQYIEKETKKSPEEQQEKLDKFSSLNARVRYEIKAGNF